MNDQDLFGVRKIAVEKTTEIILHLIDHGNIDGLVNPRQGTTQNALSQFESAWEKIYEKVYNTLTATK